MNPIWVALTYGSAVMIAVLALYFFHARHWYWHALAIGIAVAIGIVKFPEQWAGPALDLTVGFFFVLFAVWGFGAPLFRKSHHTVHKHA